MTEQITALVTGANRGLGRQFAAELVARGAKVYAGARKPEAVDLPGVIPVQLDITDPESVRRAAEVAGDVTVLVNNAGVSTRAGLLTGTIDDIRLEMDTHYFGTLNVSREFVPIIEKNGGGERYSTFCRCWPGTTRRVRALTRQPRPPPGHSPMRCELSWRPGGEFTSPPYTSGTWTPTWSATSRPTRRSTPPRWWRKWPWTACSPGSPKYWPTI